MLSRDIFENISPLDHRYSLRKEEFTEYREYLSERANIKYQIMVEVALVKTLAEYGICSEEIVEEIEEKSQEITVEEIYEEEKKTRHNIRALVNCIQRRISKEARPFVHFTATSYDIVDTANALKYKEISEKLIIPVLKELEMVWMDIALREKETVQIGRTHGQHAVPVTFGFTMAEYVSRLGNRIKEINNSALTLRGKISGAVGAYNASSLFFSEPEKFEKSVLEKLGLEPGIYSTQIVEAEYLTDFVHALISCFGVLANFSDDMRHLQRSEIGEVGEFFSEDQVGSSTMPHKRNPINYENVKSMWKQFMPYMITTYQNQISEHQRDLTNSASGRFLAEVITGLLLSANRLIRVSKKMGVDNKNIENNFAKNKEFIVAEPLYILLAAHGHPDAHEAVRKLTLKAEKTGKNLSRLIYNSAELKPYLANFNPKQIELLKNPEKYTGIATEKTENVVKYWQKELGLEK